MKALVLLSAVASVAAAPFPQNLTTLAPPPFVFDVSRSCREHLPTFNVSIRVNEGNHSFDHIYFVAPNATGLDTFYLLNHLQGDRWAECMPVPAAATPGTFRCNFERTRAVASNESAFWQVVAQPDVRELARTNMSISFFAAGPDFVAGPVHRTYGDSFFRDCPPPSTAGLPAVLTSVSPLGPVCGGSPMWFDGIRFFRFNISARNTSGALPLDHRILRIIIRPDAALGAASFNHTDAFVWDPTRAEPVPCRRAMVAGVGAYVCRARQSFLRVTNHSVVLRVGLNATSPRDALGAANDPVVPYELALTTTYLRDVKVPFYIRSVAPACQRFLNISKPMRECREGTATYWFTMRHSGTTFDNDVIRYFDMWPNATLATPTIITASGSGTGPSNASASNGGLSGGVMMPGDLLWVRVGEKDGDWAECRRGDGKWRCFVNITAAPANHTAARIWLRIALDTTAGHRPLSLRLRPAVPPIYRTHDGVAFNASSLAPTDDGACGGMNAEHFVGRLHVRPFGPVCFRPNPNATNATFPPPARVWGFGLVSEAANATTAAFENLTYPVTRVVVNVSAPVFGLPLRFNATSADPRQLVNDTLPPAGNTTVWLQVWGRRPWPCTPISLSAAVCPVPEGNDFRVGNAVRPVRFNISATNPPPFHVNFTVAVFAAGHGAGWAVTNTERVEALCAPRPPVPVGALNISSDNETAHRMCPPLILFGYGVSCPASRHLADCAPHGFCGAGFIGAPQGKYVCLYGEWKGNVSGCAADPMGVAGPSCATAYTPPGYAANCTAGTRHGGWCHAGERCAAGYGGVPRGRVTCVNGGWINFFTGCAPVCTLPPAVCTPGSGVLEQFRVRIPTVTANASFRPVDSATCALGGANDASAIEVSCAEGYGLEGGNATVAKCVSGTLVGGWVTQVPTCVKRDADDLIRNCGCGGRPLNVRVRNGKVKKTVPTTASGEWECSMVEKTVSCVCKCKPAAVVGLSAVVA